MKVFKKCQLRKCWIEQKIEKKTKNIWMIKNENILSWLGQNIEQKMKNGLEKVKMFGLNKKMEQT